MSLKNRWDELTAEYPAEISKKWWSLIENDYGEKSRNYHNTKHLEQMFINLDWCVKNIQSLKSVSFAIFFHDLVYNPKAGDNEEKSADLFKDFAKEAGIPLDSLLFTKVNNLIILTKTHLTDEHAEVGKFGTEDKHYFLDIDLAILGSSCQEYNEYSQQIREEYSFIPDETYNGMRAKVLKNFLQIPNIFATQEFRDKFEGQARKNIEDEIKRLEN